MKQLKGIIISIIAILSILVAVYEVLVPEETSTKTNAYDQVLEFPKEISRNRETYYGCDKGRTFRSLYNRPWWRCG